MEPNDIELNADTGIEADTNSTQSARPEAPMGIFNTVELGDGAYPDGKDGDDVTTQVDGVLHIVDGKRTLEVKATDGVPVVSANEEETEPQMSDDDLEGAISDFSDQNVGLKGYAKK